MIDDFSIAFHAFASRILISLSVDVILLPRYVNSSINFSGFPVRVEIAPSSFVLFAFTYNPMLPSCCFKLCSRDSAWTGVFTRSIRSSV